jgi:hypothetical protein
VPLAGVIRCMNNVAIASATRQGVCSPTDGKGRPNRAALCCEAAIAQPSAGAEGLQATLSAPAPLSHMGVGRSFGARIKEPNPRASKLSIH